MSQPPGAFSGPSGGLIPPVAAVKGRARGRARGRPPPSDDSLINGDQVGSGPGSIPSFGSRPSSDDGQSSASSLSSSRRYNRVAFRPNLGMPDVDAPDPDSPPANFPPQPHPLIRRSHDEASLVSGFESFISSDRSNSDGEDSGAGEATDGLSFYDQSEVSSESPSNASRLLTSTGRSLETFHSKSSQNQRRTSGTTTDIFSRRRFEELGDLTFASDVGPRATEYVGARRGAFRGHAHSTSSLSARPLNRGATAFGRGCFDGFGAAGSAGPSDTGLVVSNPIINNEDVATRTGRMTSTFDDVPENRETETKIDDGEELWREEPRGARAKTLPLRDRSAKNESGGGNQRGNRGVGRGGRAGRGSRGGRSGGRRRLDPLEEQMQRLSLGKRVPPNIVHGKDGMKELISYMTVNTKPKQFRNENGGKRGETGTPVKLFSNSFHVDVANDWWLYQYVVHFNPEQEGKRIRKQLVYNLKEKLFHGAMIFDGMIAYSPVKLLDQPTVVNETRQYDGFQVQLTLKLTNELPPGSPSVKQMYNVLLRESEILMGMTQVGRYYYNPNDPTIIPKHHIELWPGFSTRIDTFDQGTLLCLDVQHKVLRQDSVLDAIYEIEEEAKRRKIDKFSLVAKKLVGEVCLTRYNNKTYKIDEVDWSLNPNSSFNALDGQLITYHDYFERAYNKRIMDSKQPLLVSRVKKKEKKVKNSQNQSTHDVVHLIPELCTLTGLKDEMRRDFNVMRDLATHSRMAPTERIERMRRFIREIRSQPESAENMSTWGLTFDQDVSVCDGRELDPEQISQGGKFFNYDVKDSDWSRIIRNVRFNEPRNLQSWFIFYPGHLDKNAHQFAHKLKQACQGMGMTVNNPEMVSVGNDKTDSYIKALKNKVDSDRTDMVVCVFPNNRKDRYDTIKKFVCVDVPVPSQMVIGKTISKPDLLPAVATKIAIQMNCKLGGEIWNVMIPFKKTGSLMVVGVDTYHDCASKGFQIGAVVSSYNETLTRWFSRHTRQKNHHEFCQGLKAAMVSSLRHFRAVNGVLPERVMIYRDGVGDGQLDVVRDQEIRYITASFDQISSNYRPKLTVTVVTRRIPQRFFRQSDTGFLNPLAGTVVDNKLTKMEFADFYLVSQSVNQGTVTPTHYNIIWDESGLKADHHQRLAYKLTHLYYNWAGTIRVPAPCQYAHKLAFVIGQSLHSSPHQDLSPVLWYL